MYWWWRASQLLKNGIIQRFGFVTTNKIAQSFNRTVLEGFLRDRPSSRIAFAIPDHPWNDDDTSAAVRVAFTVGELGEASGVLQSVVRENIDGSVELATSSGRISANLTVGAAYAEPKRLSSNVLLAHQGVIPLGEGFRLSAKEVAALGYPEGPESGGIKPYKIGRDLLRRDQGLFIIDLYGLEWKNVSERFPKLAQIVLDRVKPERDENRRPRRKERFWLFADTCEDMREALRGQRRYIATCRTAKHRVFVFLEGHVIPDAKIVAITLEQPEVLGLLSSRLHVLFAINQGGRQGAGSLAQSRTSGRRETRSCALAQAQLSTREVGR